jgi:hypothetical protein
MTSFSQMVRAITLEVFDFVDTKRSTLWTETRPSCSQTYTSGKHLSALTKTIPQCANFAGTDDPNFIGITEPLLDLVTFVKPSIGNPDVSPIPSDDCYFVWSFADTKCIVPRHSPHLLKLGPSIALERSIHPKIDRKSFQLGVPQDCLAHFYGRDDVLCELDRSFTESSRTKVVLWAIGSVGYFVLFSHLL